MNTGKNQTGILCNCGKYISDKTKHFKSETHILRNQQISEIQTSPILFVYIKTYFVYKLNKNKKTVAGNVPQNPKSSQSFR